MGVGFNLASDDSTRAQVRDAYTGVIHQDASSSPDASLASPVSRHDPEPKYETASMLELNSKSGDPPSTSCRRFLRSRLPPTRKPPTRCPGIRRGAPLYTPARPIFRSERHCCRPASVTKENIMRRTTLVCALSAFGMSLLFGANAIAGDDKGKGKGHDTIRVHLKGFEEAPVTITGALWSSRARHRRGGARDHV
jgi:hypothetical protein